MCLCEARGHSRARKAWERNQSLGSHAVWSTLWVGYYNSYKHKLLSDQRWMVEGRNERVWGRDREGRGDVIIILILLNGRMPQKSFPRYPLIFAESISKRSVVDKWRARLYIYRLHRVGGRSEEPNMSLSKWWIAKYSPFPTAWSHSWTVDYSSQHSDRFGYLKSN